MANKQIIWGLLPDDNRHWSQGTILDPDNGKSYSLSAALEPNGTLKLEFSAGCLYSGKQKYCGVSICTLSQANVNAAQVSACRSALAEQNQDPPAPSVSGNTTLVRKFGETFHCRPSSVITRYRTVASRIVSSRTAPRDRGVLRCVHE
jgi:hypothetical protein